MTTGVWGAANFSRNFQQILTLAGQPDLPARRLIVGETLTPSGNWSTFPPHRHENEDLPREARHEELYFFKVSPRRRLRHGPLLQPGGGHGLHRPRQHAS